MTCLGPDQDVEEGAERLVSCVLVPTCDGGGRGKEGGWIWRVEGCEVCEDTGDASG